MVILSAKVSKRKILTGLLVAAAVIVLLVYLCNKADTPSAEEEQTEQTMDAGTNEGRIAFLASYGWAVAEAPTETQEVRVPEEFNDVFTRYNNLQKSQGFDLEPLAGKTLKRYVYRITNYPGGGENCYATVLVHKGKIVGGDVSCTDQGGKMHGFSLPQS